MHIRKTGRDRLRVPKEAEACGTDAALDPVPLLDRWTRETAKKVRDHYIAAGLKPASSFNKRMLQIHDLHHV